MQGANENYTKERQVVCNDGLGTQDEQPNSEDVGDELIGYLVLEKGVRCSNQDVKESNTEQHELTLVYQ